MSGSTRVLARQQDKLINIDSHNKTGPFFLEFNWCKNMF